MSNIVKWTPNLAVSRRIEEALELVNTNVPAVRREQRQDARPLFGNTGPVVREPVQASSQMVAMPRVCALVDRLYASYYVLDSNSSYRYSRSGQVNKAVFRELYSGVGVRSYKLRAADIDEESCPWCGTSGRGGIHCPMCSGFTCWGTTVDNRFWRCRPSCGYSGELGSRTVEHIGVVPRSD
jgi:hypothetical protein